MTSSEHTQTYYVTSAREIATDRCGITDEGDRWHCLERGEDGRWWRAHDYHTGHKSYEAAVKCCDGRVKRMTRELLTAAKS